MAVIVPRSFRLLDEVQIRQGGRGDITRMFFLCPMFLVGSVIIFVAIGEIKILWLCGEGREGKGREGER